MKSIPLLSGLLLLFAASCTAQESADSPAASIDQPSGSPAIRWLSFEEAVALHAVEPKKLFIDVYTDWCGWCKRMDKTTFVDSAVASELGGHFYAVKLNAERKELLADFGEHGEALACFARRDDGLAEAGFAKARL